MVFILEKIQLETLNLFMCYILSIVFLIVVCLTIIGSIAFYKTEKGSAKTFSLLLQRSSALQMVTVILIILSAVCLRILNLIESNAIVSILSGISGYVLGSTNHSKQGSEEKTTT